MPAPNTGFVAIAAGGSSSLAIKGAPVTAVGEPERGALLGARPLIRALAPNPSASSTTVLFETPVSGSLTLDIYDAGGRFLRRVDLGNVTSGLHRTLWDHHDADGTKVTPGVYLFRLRGAATDGCGLLEGVRGRAASTVTRGSWRSTKARARSSGS